MNIIIDTHIFLWALSVPNKISDTKRSALEDLSNTIYVSAVSIAELMIKASIQKLRIDFDPVVMAKESGFMLLDFTMKTHKTMLKNQSVFSYPWVARIFWIRPCRFSAEAALLLKDMPFYHKDPFD